MKNYTGQFLTMGRPVFFHKYCYNAYTNESHSDII